MKFNFLRPNLPAYEGLLFNPMPFVYNENYKTENMNPFDVPKYDALKNGNEIYENFVKYLQGKKMKGFEKIYDFFSVTDPLTLREKQNYVKFYKSDEHKIWLGRQFYLLTTSREYRTSSDDILFFNWLIRRPNIQCPLKNSSPNINLEI